MSIFHKYKYFSFIWSWKLRQQFQLQMNENLTDGCDMVYHNYNIYHLDHRARAIFLYLIDTIQ